MQYIRDWATDICQGSAGPGFVIQDWDRDREMNCLWDGTETYWSDEQGWEFYYFSPIFETGTGP